MNRDEFTRLPPSMALGVLYDLVEGRIDAIKAPKVPLAPKFDGRMWKSGKYYWMSEMTLRNLAYWHGRNEESAAEGGQYAEKNAKTAKALGYWVNWRTAYPDAIWSGERYNVHAVANPPSGSPQMHEPDNDGKTGEGYGGKPWAAEDKNADPFAPESAPADDDDIPF